MNVLEIDRTRVEPIDARCTDSDLTITLAHGQKILPPLWWYPRLLRATPEQRSKCELSPFGVHWEEIDEDLSIEQMLIGAKAPHAVPPAETGECLGNAP